MKKSLNRVCAQQGAREKARAGKCLFQIVESQPAYLPRYTRLVNLFVFRWFLVAIACLRLSSVILGAFQPLITTGRAVENPDGIGGREVIGTGLGDRPL
jgi:hypothetical protein